MLGERIGERRPCRLPARREPARSSERGERDPGSAPGRRRPPRRGAATRALCGGDRQACLPRPSRAGERHETDVVASEQGDDRCDLEPPSDQRRRGRGKRSRQRGVVPEDRALQPTEPAARFDAEPVGQHPSRGVMRLEPLPSGAPSGTARARTAREGVPCKAQPRSAARARRRARPRPPSRGEPRSRARAPAAAPRRADRPRPRRGASARSASGGPRQNRRAAWMSAAASSGSPAASARSARSNSPSKRSRSSSPGASSAP